MLIHGVLLLRVFSPFPVRLNAPATTIRAVISRDSSAASEKPDRTQATKPLSAPAKPAAPVVRIAPERRIAVARPAKAAVASGEPAVERDAGPAAPPSALAGGGASSLASAPPVAAREGVSADDVRQYRVSLATAARRFKRYPALARERGWEGTAEVAVNGSVLLPAPEVVLVHSSGRRVLDEQALDMVAQAARATNLPDGLKGRDFRILLPVNFSLETDQ